MASEAGKVDPDNEGFLPAKEFLLQPLNVEKLQRLLSDEAWKRFVAVAKLPSDEAEALHEDLSQLEGLMTSEGKGKMSDEQSRTEMILEEFSRMKQKLEESIRKIYELADKVDKAQKESTNSHFVDSTIRTVYGLLTVAGLALAPFTEGTSLALSAIGLGVAGTLALRSIPTSIVEHLQNQSAKDEANRLMSGAINNKEVVMEVLGRANPQVVSLIRGLLTLKDIVDSAGAYVPGVTTPSFGGFTKAFLAGGRMGAGSGQQEEKGVGGTPRALSDGAAVFGTATAVIFLLADVVSLVIDTVHLQEGSRLVSAEELRQQARELESRLRDLNWIHKILQKALMERFNSQV